MVQELKRSPSDLSVVGKEERGQDEVGEVGRRYVCSGTWNLHFLVPMLLVWGPLFENPSPEAFSGHGKRFEFYLQH